MNANTVVIEEPPMARMLFSDTRFGWLWLPLRLYLGYMWFEAGWHKCRSEMDENSGEALIEYWKRGLDRWLLPAVGTPWKAAIYCERSYDESDLVTGKLRAPGYPVHWKFHRSNDEGFAHVTRY